MRNIISQEEKIIDGLAYIVTTYDDGVIITKLKNSPSPEPEPEPEPQPQDPPVTNEELQAQIAELQEQNVAVMMGLVDMFAAITTGGAE